MSDVTEYSVGIDLGQTPWRVAMAQGGIAEMSTTADDRSVAPPGSGDDPGLSDRVVDTIRKVAQRFGGTPSGVVLCVSGDVRASNADLAGEVARRLGLQLDRVWTIGNAEAVSRWLAHVSEPGRGGADSGAVGDRVAIGAALSGTATGAEQPNSAMLAAGAAGAVGATIGGAGAAMLAGPPTAVAAEAIGGVGPGGVSLGGVPRVATVLVRRFPRIPVIVGAAAVVIVGAGVAIVASGDDAVTTEPTTTAFAMVIPETDPATTVVVVTTLVPATLAPTSLAPTTVATAVVSTTELAASASSATAATVPSPSSSACAVGSWLLDNDAILAWQNKAAGNNPIRWDAVTGTAQLDISPDGSVVTTYGNWTQTSTLGGAGNALTAVSGVDTNTVVFADDGTYSVTATQIGSQTLVSSGGFVVRDGPSQDTMLQGSAAYTCSGDRLDIVTNVATDFVAFEMTMVFTRTS